jgi:hypothetical protein
MIKEQLWMKMTLKQVCRDGYGMVLCSKHKIHVTQSYYNHTKLIHESLNVVKP